MRDQYQAQLQALHEALVEMGGMCQQAIEIAIQLLTNDDKELIIKEQEIDSAIDKKEREIEALCLQLLLKQQPVATDLRDVSAALKMISDMERIGDQATDIAEIAVYLRQHPEANKTDLQQMAKAVIQMVHQSIESFVRRDMELANKVIASDDVVDEYFDKMKQEIVTLVGQDNTLGAYCMDLLMVAKYLERIGDHATNIAEWVDYSITGKRPKDGVMPEGEQE